MLNWLSNTTVQTARRIIVAIVGTTIVLAGVAMLVLPGPGLVTIGAGLALLSLEFAFAQRWLRVVRQRSQQAADHAGIPKPMRRLVVIGGIVLGVAMMLVPGCVAVINTPDGWEFVRREQFTYAHAFTNAGKLERAAAEGDDRAVRLLESLQWRPSPSPREEETP